MSMFDAINTANTGVDMSQTWMNAISNNLANINDATRTSQKAYQAEFPVVTALGGGQSGTGSGVAVIGVAHGSAAGITVYDPSSPLADAKGMVREPNVDLAQQMTDLIMAQRTYQANVNAISTAEQTYQDGLGLKP